MIEDKKTIRKRILKIRESLTKDEVNRLSKLICNNFLSIPEFNQIEKIAFYYPIRNEVNVTLLWLTLWGLGKKIYLPKVYGSTMDFYLYNEDDELITGAYDIPEPQNTEILIPDTNTIVIMPGSVFSESKERIGYGGGYYDIYLEQHKEAKKIAFCYDFQILKELPTEAHDIKPDIIISENRVIY